MNFLNYVYGIVISIFLKLFYDIFTFKRTKIEDAKNHLPEDYLKNVPEEIKKKLDPLDMKQYWYPICFSKDVTLKKQHGFKLFDEPLVLYRGKDEKIVCVQDLCPHRSAKLSLGIVCFLNLR
jgi:hypothetical protein